MNSQFDWYERRKESLSNRKLFLFLLRQFNWCHLLICAKEFKFFVKRIYMIKLYSFSYICFDMAKVNLYWIRFTKSTNCTTILFWVRDFCITKFIFLMRGCDEVVIFWKIIGCSLTKTMYNSQLVWKHLY